MRLYIEGEPKGKGRPRFTRNGRVYTPKATADYEKQIKEVFKADCDGFYPEEPLRVSIDAFFEIPKSYSKKKKERILNGFLKCTKKPDIDNIIKIVLDALNGVAWADDKQIVCVLATKRYTEGTPYVLVEIEEDKA